MGLLTITSGSSAAAATQTKYESLTEASVLFRFDNDSLLSIADNTIGNVFAITGKDNLRLRIDRNFSLLNFVVFQNNEGSMIGTGINRSILTAGGVTTVSFWRTQGGGSGTVVSAEIIVRQSGTTLAAETSTLVYPALQTGTGKGDILFGNTALGYVLDAAYIFNRRLTATEHDTEPTTASSGLVGGYPIAETSGSSTADMVAGGTALTLVGSTLSVGGDWNGSGSPPTPVIDTLRFIDETVPNPIIAGTLYELQVEAWDSILGVRVTSFTGNITIGIDVDVPVGYIISSGTLTQPAVSGVATFSDIVFSPLTSPPVINSSTNTGLFGSLF